MNVQTPSPDQIRAGWDALAGGYDAGITTHNMALAERALDRVGVRAGDKLLDVAAGSGALAIPAARRGARVVATDISPVMIERLRVRARAEGLSGLETRVCDGHALDFADDTFDIAASQFGVMLFPDLPRGLAELARVTKPGGKVLVVAFNAPGKQEWLRFFVGAIKAVMPDSPGLPADPPPLPFQVADPDRFRDRLVDATLTGVTIETITHELAFSSGQELYETVSTSNPIGAALVADLTAEQRAEVVRVLDGMLHERSGGPGGVVTSKVNIAVATPSH